MFYKKCFPKKFRNIPGKHLCWSLFLIKLQAFRVATLLKRDSNTGVFLSILELFKVWFSSSKIILCYLLDSKQFKSDENAFYFILKALFVFKICKFLSRLFWSCRKNGLIRNISLTLKIMTSQPGLQTFAIHILQNISKSKDNRIIKFGQLIEQNKINIFLQKLCGK